MLIYLNMKNKEICIYVTGLTEITPSFDFRMNLMLIKNIITRRTHCKSSFD